MVEPEPEARIIDRARIAYATGAEELSQNDLRVRRTNQFIREALAVLLAEKAFEEITVQDIADRAFINRATFYRHYQDKYDLVIRVVNDILDELMAELVPPPAHPQDVTFERPPEVWIKLFRHIQVHAQLYRLVLTEGGVGEFRRHFERIMESLFTQRLRIVWERSQQPRMPFEVLVGYSIASFQGMIIWWLENDTPHTPEQMALWTLQLIVPGPYMAMGLELPRSSAPE
jgi:AcrR family transcriptional regulator